MAGRLENLARFLNKWFFVLMPLVLFVVAFALVTDYQQPWIRAMVSSSLVKKVGKAFGEIAVNFMVAAAFYYVLREACVRARRLNIAFPAWLDLWLKYWIGVLRLLHPVLGLFVLAAVLFHGYIMWLIWLDGNWDLAVWTGLLAAGILILATLSGLFVHHKPRILKGRYLHRVMGIAFLVAYAIHNATE
jgi:hypothetical protein